MTKQEFWNFMVGRGYLPNGKDELIGGQYTGKRSERPIKNVYILGKNNPKKCMEYQDDGERTELKNLLNYSEMEIVDGKLARKAPEKPVQEVFELTAGKESRNCSGCKGSGVSDFVFEGKRSKCCYCHGEPVFYAPDFKALVAVITTKEGKLKTSKPVEWQFQFKSSSRAYYLWRIARFHGGVDVTMPMNAEFVIQGDPFYNELEQAAQYIAKKLLGTDMAAAYRWANALGHSVNVPNGMPETAYSCGPVVIGEKPEVEALELV